MRSKKSHTLNKTTVQFLLCKYSGYRIGISDCNILILPTIYCTYITIEVSLEPNLLGEKGEKRKLATVGLEPRVSDSSHHNH